MGKSRNYDAQKVKGLIERCLKKGKDSESALVELSQIENIPGEVLADVAETIQKYKSLYETAEKKNRWYLRMINTLLKE